MAPIIVAIANQKGGVGKTTTTQNLGACLARLHNKKVLLVDADPQSNLTDACGIHPEQPEKMIYDLLSRETTPTSPEEQRSILLEHILPLAKNLDILPSNIRLAAAEQNLISRVGRENILKKNLRGASDYAFVLIDCPPSVGILTLNAMAAAHFLLIPVQAEYHAMAGLRLVYDTFVKIKADINPTLHIIGLLPTLYDTRKKLNVSVVDALKNFQQHIFRSGIRDNVTLAEAPSHGKDIISYSPKSYGAEDYTAFTKEFLTHLRKKLRANNEQ